MRLLASVMAVLVSFGVTACNKKNDNSPVDTGTNTIKELGIYPTPPTGFWGSSNPISSTGWVGDVMPYYENGKYHIFFLHDATDAEKAKSAGQHSIHKFTSSNLSKFSYEGEMIPFGNSSNAEHLLGTGSVLKYKNEYYFYYTGHNGSPAWTASNPREVVLKATSSNLNTWSKKSGFALSAPAPYTSWDFRDPYVFFNEEFNEYWMLVSTRKNGKGVLARFTTNDPSTDNWVLKGDLDVEGEFLMLECADIFKMGNYYYLFFAEDWSTSPGTRYRVATSSLGPWRKPEAGSDMLDGHNFYAAKTASDGTTRYAFAWVHRRNPENDSGSRTWGGNLVVHKLTQVSDGSLGVTAPISVSSQFTSNMVLQGANTLGEVTEAAGVIEINGNNTTSARTFSKIPGSVKISASIKLEKSTGSAGFIFNSGSITAPTYKILFDPSKSRIAAYNVVTGSPSEVTRVPFDVKAGVSMAVDIIIEGSVCVLYVDGKVALTNRIYSMAGSPWGLIAEGNKMTVTNLSISTP